MRFTGLWWWIDRWRKSTAYTDMTLEQQAAYRNLLDEATLRGGVSPNNERIVAKSCGDQMAWRRVRRIVLAKFSLDADGNLRNATLDEILSRSRAIKNARISAGSQGAAVRWGLERNSQKWASTRTRDGKPDGKPHGKPIAKVLPPDPDPDPYKKKKKKEQQATSNREVDPTMLSPPHSADTKQKRRPAIPGSSSCPHTPRCRSSQ